MKYDNRQFWLGRGQPEGRKLGIAHTARRRFFSAYLTTTRATHGSYRFADRAPSERHEV